MEMLPRVLRCPFSCGRKGISGAGLILVLALSACGTTHGLDASRSTIPPVPSAAAYNAVPVASATPKAAAAHSSHARDLSPASARPRTASTAASAARAATSQRTAAVPTARRSRTTKNAARSSAPTAADLQGALLTTADMPAGYSVQPGGGSALAGSSISGCPQLASNPSGVTDQATVALADPPDNPSVGETLLQLSPADADSAMASYAAVATDCSQFTAVVDHYNVAFTTEPLSVGALGDQTSAVHITGHIESASQPIYVDFVAIRHGGTVIVLVDVSLTSDTAFTTQIASKAYAKVAALG
jgi:hypothetical protein